MTQSVTQEMNIADVLHLDPGISNILFASGMHCLGCIMAAGESLGEAAAVHGIDADELVQNINDYLSQK